LPGNREEARRTTGGRQVEMTLETVKDFCLFFILFPQNSSFREA
jgi:hypothetical protein